MDEHGARHQQKGEEMTGHRSAKVAAVCVLALVVVSAGYASTRMKGSGSGPLAAAVSAKTILGAGPFSPNTLDPDPKGIVDEQTNFMMAAQWASTLLTVRPPKPGY